MNKGLECWIGERQVARDIRELHSFWAKGRGFMGTKRPADGHGYLFRKTRSLHTFFMRFALDVVYLDAEDRVVNVVTGLQPWRISVGAPRAKHALEVPAGILDLDQIDPGQHVTFRSRDG